MTLPLHMYCKPAPRHLFRGEWKSVREIAEIIGVTPRTVNRRIQLGLPIEGPARMGPKPRKFLFRGKKKTIAEIMLATGLSRSQVSKRTDGIRFFEKWELKDPYGDPHPIEHRLFYRGINDSVSGWARRTGIPRHVISERINRGWSVKRALTEPAMRGGQRTVFYHNRRIIRRIAASFRSSSMTGGSSQTFTPPKGTGGGRHETHFEGASA